MDETSNLNMMLKRIKNRIRQAMEKIEDRKETAMFEIRKKFRFEAAHALISSYSKECRNIHGHSYTVEVFLRSNKLNAQGVVMDFKLLGEIVRDILKQWDHKIILCKEDEERIDMFQQTYSRFQMDPDIVVVPWNPTAEYMARYLAWKIRCRMDRHEHIRISVRVHETESDWVQYTEEGEY